MITCTHCGHGITEGQYPTHTDGGYRGKMRCDPAESGLPYGYNAHAVGTECEYPCLGDTKKETP